MLMCLNNNTCLARYEYDSFGICTVYDGDGKINTDPNFIGNINPFRWKSFYFDTESNLYYANGSYYDPETGQYIDAAPISTAIDNALMTRSLDRNGLMCNNTIELAGNPYTIEPATGLSSDPTYNPTDKLPNWLKRRIERQKRLQEIYNRIPWYAKVIVGTVLLAASIALTLVSRTGGAGVASIFIQLALGIGIGVGTYLASSLLTDTFTPEGLLNTVLDTFVITTAVIFISASINYIKYLTRSKPVTTGELAQETVETNSALQQPNKITGYTRHGLDQAMFRDGHGIHPKGILDAVRNPVEIIYDASRDTYKFIGSKSVTVLNRQGKIVSTWALKSLYWRY